MEREWIEWQTKLSSFSFQVSCIEPITPDKIHKLKFDDDDDGDWIHRFSFSLTNLNHSNDDAFFILQPELQFITNHHERSAQYRNRRNKQSVLLS